MVAASCSLMHSPVSLELEPDLDPELHDWLAFADQKLIEISELRDLLIWRAPLDALHNNETSYKARSESQRIHKAEVQARAAAVTTADLARPSAFSQRRKAQRERLQLPLFPTTTIGSFPQTAEVRRTRARFRKGEVSPGEYRDFLREETARCVQQQEILGIDMPVHGEFERTDIVEYFAYPNEIGPGVYDIHSPRVPSVEEMQTLLEKAAAVLPVEHLWVNPDCGLKTRAWPETRAALENLVAAAKAMRAKYADSKHPATA